MQAFHLLLISLPSRCATRVLWYCLAKRRVLCVFLVEQNTERSAVHAGFVKVTYTERPALTLPKGFTFLLHYWLERRTMFHTVLWHPQNASFCRGKGEGCAQGDTPTLPENEGGQFLYLCMLRIPFKCSISPYATVGQIIITAAL